jgi:hypothetical protein
MALLLQIAFNVMRRYEITCGMFAFEMPSHLRRPPSARPGWGGVARDLPHRDWIWVKIARRCLIRRVHPMELMVAVGSDFGDTHYPPPLEHYLDQIDFRGDELLARRFGSLRIDTDDSHLNLLLELKMETGRMGGSNPEDIALALTSVAFRDKSVFVFSLAWLYSIDHLRLRVAPRAAMQYACSKEAFDAVYGDLIPPPLKRVGEALCDFVDREGD